MGNNKVNMLFKKGEEKEMACNSEEVAECKEEQETERKENDLDRGDVHGLAMVLVDVNMSNGRC